MNLAKTLLGALLISLSNACVTHDEKSAATEARVDGLPFAGDWVETRVSEASTVFFPESTRGRRRLVSLHQDPMNGGWLVTVAPENRRSVEVFQVVEMTTAPNGQTLGLVALDGSNTRADLTLYPFWDIPGTVVAIWKTPGVQDNPVTFLRPAVEMAQIPYLPE